MDAPNAPLPASFSARLLRLNRQRLWFGRLRLRPGPLGATVEMTGWQGWTRLRWTFVVNSRAEVVWDDASPEANLWLVVGEAPPVGLHVHQPRLVRAGLDEALRRVSTPRSASPRS